MFFVCCVPTTKGGMKPSKYANSILQAVNGELGFYYKVEELHLAEDLALLLSRENPGVLIYITRATKVIETPPGKVRVKEITEQGEKIPV